MSSSNQINDISEILEKYSKDITDKVEEIIKADMSEARKELSATSPRGESGKYARSWTVKNDGSKLAPSYVIYNREPGLPHLLENGHLVSNGTGRVVGSADAIEHIASVNDKVQQKVVEDIERMISST